MTSFERFAAIAGPLTLGASLAFGYVARRWLPAGTLVATPGGGHAQRMPVRRASVFYAAVELFLVIVLGFLAVVSPRLPMSGSPGRHAPPAADWAGLFVAEGCALLVLAIQVMTTVFSRPPAKARTELTAFVDEACEAWPMARIGAESLFESYLDWCHRRGVPAESRDDFEQGISALGYQSDIQQHGSVSHWMGLKIRSTAEDTS